MRTVTTAMYDELTKVEELVVLDFWAPWCGPCKMQAPVFEAVAAKHPEVYFGKVNVDNEIELAQRFGIMSIPTIVYLKGGQLIKKTTGYQEEFELESYIEEFA